MPSISVRNLIGGQPSETIKTIVIIIIALSRFCSFKKQACGLKLFFADADHDHCKRKLM